MLTILGSVVALVALGVLSTYRSNRPARTPKKLVAPSDGMPAIAFVDKAKPAKSTGTPDATLIVNVLWPIN
jgi:hypothetical protein